MHDRCSMHRTVLDPKLEGDEASNPSLPQYGLFAAAHACREHTSYSTIGLVCILGLTSILDIGLF
jgi:hypothetical protein